MPTVRESRPDSGAGAPADEIEITPEMLRAGVDAIDLWSASDLSEWKAIDVYRQMERARRATAVLTVPEPQEGASPQSQTA